MADTATRERAPRRTPKLADTYEGEIPPSQRNGFWVNEVEKIKAEPNKTFVYEDVSPTTASNLRKHYGLNAHTRTKDGVSVLHVKYQAELVDQIKAEVAERGNKRKAAAAAKGAPKGAPASKAK